MNIYLVIIALLIIKNHDIFGKVFYENSFLLGSEGWIITGNKLESDALHQAYTLLQSDKNCNTQMSRYITGKDDLVNVDSKNKDDKNLWYFKSPPIKITLDKTSGKPVLLTFTLTSFMGDFRHLNRCSALIKIKVVNGKTISYPYVANYDGKMVSFNVPLRGDLWYNDAETKVNFDTIFDAEFEIEILGDWTRGVEVIGLDNVIIY